MVKRVQNCLKRKTYEIKIVVKMLLKTVRREDPIELNYNSLKNQKLISNKKR